MNREPIFAHLADEARHLGHEVSDWFHPSHYHRNQITSTPGVTVSLATIEQGIKTAVDDVIGKVRSFEESIAPHVQGLADVADQVAQSPLVQAALSAVLSPADEAMIVGIVQRFDQAAHQLPAAPAAPAGPPAEPVPAEPVPAPGTAA